MLRIHPGMGGMGVSLSNDSGYQARLNALAPPREENRVNETFDFVVVGSGGGSMCAALAMRSLGKSVLILEKTDLVGGTTASRRPRPGGE